MRDIVREDLPRVERLLETVLGSAAYRSVERMGGLTNHTYKVTMADGAEYVVRIPGEGTEELLWADGEELARRAVPSAFSRYYEAARAELEG